ncbi:MAG: prepilin-type N-terminal cleavage/methylation domain-containing protein [Proteobacteria bacterium]|nr:prepilin-type N-terminal cleavage/methylation domain-containing protein [Pseudomonadota bacterium]MBU1738802.1 prepilin-type N-terminal cleavage/methylation domain-containing protein [Pseudomonadota bacterium]
MMSRKLERGFTLIELMVALVIASLAMVGIYRGYVGMVVANETQEDVIALNQSMRIVLDRMVDDIRLAGYNPQQVQVATGDPTIRFNNTSATGFSFRGDIRDLGRPVSIRTINYAIAPTGPGIFDLRRTESIPGALATTDTLIENLEVLDLVYLDDARNVLPPPVANPESIRSVQIALVVRVGDQDPTYSHDETYGNIQGILFPGYPKNDRFHRRCLTMEVKCRNNS